MIRTLLASTAFFVAGPAMAQATSEPATQAAATPAPVQPANASDANALDRAMDGGNEGATASSEASPVTPDQPVNSADQVAQVVEGQFPGYDADSSGTLDKTEFSAWMVALKDEQLKASGETMADADKMAWAAGAFATADADKSSTVTKEELSKFLGGA